MVMLAFSIACVEGWAQIYDTVVTNIQDTNTAVLWVAEKQVFHGDHMKFLAENLQYPLLAMQRGVEGKIIIEFIIEKNGSVSNVKCIKGIGGGCDEEGERIVGLTNGMWSAGKNDGKPVRLRMMQPIIFKLSTKKK